jgi:hypothetical protein
LFPIGLSEIPPITRHRLERHFLGAMLLYPWLVHIAIRRLTPRAFHNLLHRQIVVAAQEMHRRGIPVCAVAVFDFFGSAAPEGLAVCLGELLDEAPPENLAALYLLALEEVHTESDRLRCALAALLTDRNAILLWDLIEDEREAMFLRTIGGLERKAKWMT